MRSPIGSGAGRSAPPGPDGGAGTSSGVRPAWSSYRPPGLRRAWVCISGITGVTGGLFVAGPDGLRTTGVRLGEEPGQLEEPGDRNAGRRRCPRRWRAWSRRLRQAPGTRPSASARTAGAMASSSGVRARAAAAPRGRSGGLGSAAARGPAAGVSAARCRWPLRPGQARGWGRRWRWPAGPRQWPAVWGPWARWAASSACSSTRQATWASASRGSGRNGIPGGRPWPWPSAGGDRRARWARSWARTASSWPGSSTCSVPVVQTSRAATGHAVGGWLRVLHQHGSQGRLENSDQPGGLRMPECLPPGGAQQDRGADRGAGQHGASEDEDRARPRLPRRVWRRSRAGPQHARPDQVTQPPAEGGRMDRQGQPGQPPAQPALTTGGQVGDDGQRRHRPVHLARPSTRGSPSVPVQAA